MSRKEHVKGSFFHDFSYFFGWLSKETSAKIVPANQKDHFEATIEPTQHLSAKVFVTSYSYDDFFGEELPSKKQS